LRHRTSTMPRAFQFGAKVNPFGTLCGGLLWLRSD
jgi:hypothetical protein